MSGDAIDFYNRNAEDYAADSRINPRLATFLQRCRPGGLILELGSGSGHDARAMIDAGFDVDATDASSGLAAIAAQNIGRDVRIMRFQELAARQFYDGVYAGAALLHVPRAELPDVIARIHEALVVGGVLWASFKAGSAGEGHDSLGRYYNYPTTEELRAFWTDAAPWSEFDIEGWQGSGFDAQPTAWLAVNARR